MISNIHRGKKISQRSDVHTDVLALVLAGGNGTRLNALTSTECKPALSFAGSYRNIDFTLSNCVNSGMRRIAVLTQCNAHSLIHHITANWNFLNQFTGEFVELWPAQIRTDDRWYLGTANAIAQNIDLIVEHAPKYTLILAGDHVYKMDYSEMLQFHQQRDADLTVGSIEVPLADAHQFGVMQLDNQKRIVDFEEKPVSPKLAPERKDTALASMGIYLFNTEFLLRTLCSNEASGASRGHDFGRDILPWAIRKAGAQTYAYPFCNPVTGAPGYWRDVGTIDSYWEAQMDLLKPRPALDLCDPGWPILAGSNSDTPARFNTGATMAPGLAVNSLVSGGCILDGGKVDHSILSANVYVGDGSIVENSVLLPGARIGIGCRLNKVIVDSNCSVPDGTVIDIDPSVDQQEIDCSFGGVVLVTKETLTEQGLRRLANIPGSDAIAS